VVPDEGPVAELAADGPDPSFGVGVRDRRIWRGADDRRALAVKDVIEAGEELAGTVAYHEPDRTVGAHAEVPGALLHCRDAGPSGPPRDAGWVICPAWNRHRWCICLPGEPRGEPPSCPICVQRNSALSDVSEQVGVLYETRAPGTEKVNFAKRYSYLIDPEGIIAKSYEVADVNAHAETVLNDLRELQAR
jgi:hypothetical protein